MTQCTENHPETGGRFAFALAGMDDHQPLFLGLRSLDLVASSLLLAHLVRMAGVQFLFSHGQKFCRFFSHLFSFPDSKSQVVPVRTAPNWTVVSRSPARWRRSASLPSRQVLRGFSQP